MPSTVLTAHSVTSESTHTHTHISQSVVEHENTWGFFISASAAAAPSCFFCVRVCVRFNRCRHQSTSQDLLQCFWCGAMIPIRVPEPGLCTLCSMPCTCTYGTIYTVDAVHRTINEEKEEEEEEKCSIRLFVCGSRNAFTVGGTWNKEKTQIK